MYYDVYGNQLNSIYSCTGDTVWRNVEPLDISTVPSAFRTSVNDAVAYVNGFDSDWIHYPVLADSHYKLNNGNSFKIINYLYGTGRFENPIHVGDLVEAGNVGEEDWNNAVDNGLTYYHDWLFVQGNHDTGLSPLKSACDLIEDRRVKHITRTYRNAWYFDDSKNRIRIIGFHHYLHMHSSIREEVEELVDSIPNGWKWFTMSHYPMSCNSSAYCMSSDSETWLLSLINKKKNSYIMHISGHTHEDDTRMWNGFANVNLEGDLRRSTSINADSQAVTIVSINKTTKAVKCYRIGRSVKYGTFWDVT